jgi:Questin oxidase-like
MPALSAKPATPAKLAVSAMPEPSVVSAEPAVPARTPSAALTRLLDEALDYPPEYGSGFSNHLPMALAALDGLGADEARLQAFFAAQVRHLAPPVPRLPPTVLADWPAHRGRLGMFAPLQAGFDAALREQGRDAVLREALPRLVTGIGAAAFHGAIRTAHAVESRHDGELAAALAYWAARWMPLPVPAPASEGMARVADWLDAIDREFVREGDRVGDDASGFISTRMLAMTRTGTWQHWAGALQTDGRDGAALLHELARAAAARYAASRNFTVLHMATGARAARVLLPWLPGAADALAPLWHAVAAASMSSGLAFARPASARVSGLDWAAVRARAIASDDEHVVKLVHAMVVQNAAQPDPVWLRAAAAAVRG